MEQYKGKRVIWVCLSEERKRNLWRLPLDGRAPMQLTHYGPGYASRIQFSADGRWLLVSRSERLPGEVVQIRKFR